MPEYRKQFLREKGIDPDRIENAAVKTFLGFSDMGLTTEETGEVIYELICFYIARLINQAGMDGLQEKQPVASC